MSYFVLHPEAYNDLNEIWEYIAADNLDAADRVLAEIHETITSLVGFPIRGIFDPIFHRGLSDFGSYAITSLLMHPTKHL